MELGEIQDAAADERQALLARAESVTADEWQRPTRCPGWRVVDVVWHVARMRSDPSVPPDSVDVLASLREQVAAFVSSSSATVKEADAALVEYTLHRDDLDCALGVDTPTAVDVARHLVSTRVGQAAQWAGDDGLQPVAPRGYRLVGDGVDSGFYFDGTTWQVGHDEGVPTATFGADSTTLMRLVFGRIPVSPFSANESNRAWDSRLRLTGDVRVAVPFDFMRWCYGAW